MPLAERPKIDLGLTGYDELFMTDAERKALSAARGGGDQGVGKGEGKRRDEHCVHEHVAQQTFADKLIGIGGVTHHAHDQHAGERRAEGGI